MNMAADVDHFFPWILKERGAMSDADGIWDLVFACKDCNRGIGGKFAGALSARLLTKFHKRNNWLVERHHPLHETVTLHINQDAEARAFSTKPAADLP